MRWRWHEHSRSSGVARGAALIDEMRVLIPGPLRDYTANAAAVSGAGVTLTGLLGDLDRQYPGLRFRIVDEQGRIRRHIKFFIDGVQANDLDPAVDQAKEVMIVCALSGG